MRRSHVGAFLVGVVVGTAALAGAGPRGTERFRKLDVFARALSYVEANYVEDVDEQKLVYGAVKGMVKTLDPHSAFMTPEEFAQLRADTDGEFGGVGVEIDDDKGVLVVVEPIPGSPADRAGLRKGDRIVAIDGKPTRGTAGDESASRLRGRPGTTVNVDVERAGWPKPRTIPLVREIIRVQAVESWLLEPGVPYVRIKQFQERTDREVAAALEQAKAASGGELTGLVLDLRGNPGGLLDQGVRVADLFIAKGTIVSTVGRGGRKLEVDVAREPGTFDGFAIVCLVNGGTASAAEIVAGALQDHERALVIGTQTFGKGSVQSVIELEDGSGLKLTVARYLTPSGRSIQEKGITPDMVVEQLDRAQLEKVRVKEAVQRERDLAGHLAAEKAVGARGQAPAVKTVAARLDEDHQLSMGWQTLRSWRKVRRAQAGR